MDIFLPSKNSTFSMWKKILHCFDPVLYRSLNRFRSWQDLCKIFTRQIQLEIVESIGEKHTRDHWITSSCRRLPSITRLTASLRCCLHVNRAEKAPFSNIGSSWHNFSKKYLLYSLFFRFFQKKSLATV